MKREFLLAKMCLITLFLSLTGCDEKKEYHYEDFIYLNVESVELYYGDTHQVTASPVNETFEWASENTTVATVTAGGLIEAVGVGQTNILVTQGENRKFIPVSVSVPTLRNVTARPGNKRAKLEVEIHSDRIQTVRITRMDNNESKDLDINYQSGSFIMYYDGLEEGKYSFSVICLDKYNNESTPNEVTVTVYGESYQNTLQTRPVKTTTLFGNGIAIGWLNTAGSWIEFMYVNKDGDQISRIIDSEANGDYLLDYLSDLSYSVLYLPELMAVDTFRTESVDISANADKRTFLARNASATVLACDFDLGGEGVGFHDSDNSNSAGNYGYRENLGDYNSRGVDVEGGLNIGYTNPDEWLMYTVDVVDEGDYAIDFHLSVNGSDVKCHVEVDGTASATYDLVNNSSWSDWRYYFEHNSASPPVFHLAKGKHKVKFYFESGNFNFNGLKFTWQDTP